MGIGRVLIEFTKYLMSSHLFAEAFSHHKSCCVFTFFVNVSVIKILHIFAK